MKKENKYSKKKFSAILGSGALPFFITLVTLPLLISTIGIDRYGLVAICWMITGSIGFIQLGMPRAIVQRINFAKRRPDTNHDAERASLLAAAFLITCFTSLLSGICGALFLSAYDQIFDVSGKQLQAEVRSSILWFGVLIVSSSWVNILLGVLHADERFFPYATYRFVNTASAQIAPLLTSIILSPNLSFLICSIALSRMLVVLGLAMELRRDLIAMFSANTSKRTVLDLLSVGGWMTLLGVLSPILVTFDRFAIGALLGSSAVGLYSIAYNLCSRLLVVPMSVGTYFLPRMSSSSDRSLTATSSHASRLTLVLMTPILLLFIILYRPFVSVWIDQRVADETYKIAAILVLGVFCVSMAQIPYSKLTGEGKVRLIAVWHLAQVPAYFILLWFSLNKFGILGAASVWSIRALIDSFGLYYLSQMKISLNESIALAILTFTSALNVLAYDTFVTVLLNCTILATSMFFSANELRRLENFHQSQE